MKYLKNISELDATPRDELIDVANDFEVENADGLPRQELIYRILQKQALKNAPNKDSDYFKVPTVLKK